MYACYAVLLLLDSNIPSYFVPPLTLPLHHYLNPHYYYHYLKLTSLLNSLYSCFFEGVLRGASLRRRSSLRPCRITLYSFICLLLLSGAVDNCFQSDPSRLCISQ
jgi:hypothetical protein